MGKNKKLFGFLDKRPMIWFHYVLLLGVLFASWYTGDFLFQENFTKLWLMSVWFYAWISIGDQLIHCVIGVD